MTIDEFINAIIPAIGDVCPTIGCGDYCDHICDDGIARCADDCECGRANYEPY